MGEGKEMRLVLTVLLACGAAQAQVYVACGPSPIAFSKSIFDHRTAKMVQHWSCVVENQGERPETVSEANLQGFLLRRGVTALSSDAVRIAAGEVKRRGTWETLSRVLGHGALVATALASSDVIQIGSAWGAAAGFAAMNMPRIADGIKGREPSIALFEQIAMGREGIAVEPGGSLSVAMFAARNDSAEPVMGLLRDAPEPPSRPAAMPAIDAAPPANLWAGLGTRQMMAGD